jgi:hypothetical protein
MNNLSVTQQLFAALKPEDGTSRNAIDEASQSAEARWPLLKSLATEKWVLAPPLSDEEKLNRQQLEPMPNVTRRPAASEPNINTQLANALNRMIESTTQPQAQPQAQPKTPSVKPSASISQPATAPAPKTEAFYSPPPPNALPAALRLDEDSIMSILDRIERAHAPASSAPPKATGFLARLGKK